ncbi:4'-phosphopantetheinyl transferase family protein [Alteromonas portus]|uniref:4'-phosphopantetheinyl transferase family protein n=1 Tax=Alteromonas portus TaxID=2565549 RepID=UPI003BF84B4A
MSDSPFPFLSKLPLITENILCLHDIHLFGDNLQKLILARGKFSLESYRLTDFTDLKIDLPLSIEESVNKRQAEYLSGRYLSRLAMEQCGLFYPSPPQIEIGRLRAPIWPKIVAGSITHHQYIAYAVVVTRPLAEDNFIGIDTELWLTEEQSNEFAVNIHNTEESRVLLSAGFSNHQATTLLFSAKEALFKAVCPFVGEYFGFEAARLQSCDVLRKTDSSNLIGSMQFQLTNEWIESKAPQKTFQCWFNCSDHDVLTMVCADKFSLIEL